MLKEKGEQTFFKPELVQNCVHVFEINFTKILGIKRTTVQVKNRSLVEDILRRFLQHLKVDSYHSLQNLN